MLYMSIPLLFFRPFLWSTNLMWRTQWREYVYTVYVYMRAYDTCWTHNDRQKCGKAPQLHPLSEREGNTPNEVPAHRRENIWRQTSIHRHFHTYTSPLCVSLGCGRRPGHMKHACTATTWAPSPAPGPSGYHKQLQNIWAIKCEL